jgi:hypothetical protein
MNYRKIKRFQILFLTALLIVTTGIAAAPVRKIWAPLVSRPFGQWLGDSRIRANAQQSARLSADASQSRKTSASLGAGYAITDSGSSGPGRRVLTDDVSRSEASSSRAGGSQRYESSSAAKGGDYSGGSSHLAQVSLPGHSGGGSAGAASAGGGSGSARMETAPRTERAKGVPSLAPSRPPNNGQPGNSDGGKGPADVGKPKDPGGLFGEHKTGLDQLTGSGSRKNSPLDGGLVGGGSVAVNPEPSTLLLFGTGIAAAAGAVRRRLR